MTKQKEINKWMVRSGWGGKYSEEFLDLKIIAIGWNEVGEIPDDMSKEELKTRLREVYEGWSDGKINQSAGQLWKFRNEFKIGDQVITYDSSSRQYYIGEIAGEYHFVNETGFQHVRKVDWNLIPVSRDKLPIKSRNMLGSTLTIFSIPNWVWKELNAPGPNKEAIKQSILYDDSYSKKNQEELDLLKSDVISSSTEFIKDAISSLHWEDVERLAGGLLRSMGYKTRFTARGSDLGSDITASPDVLALEEPRIRVEVKQRKENKINSTEMRSFIGGMRDFHKGIYVTTSGFTKDAKYDAERANFPITLIDSDWLVELVIENYEELEPDIKALVPLRKIYWPL